MCTIEHPHSRRSHQSNLSSINGAFPAECPLNEVLIEMEFSRCRMVAIAIDDPRGAGLLSGVAIEVEDVRCRNLAEGGVLEVEDARCRKVAIHMEDPRCQNLHSKW